MDLERFMSDQDFTLNNDLFDKIIYINLKSRPDRNRKILDTLYHMEFPNDKIVRFEAIETEKGYLGCALSHAAVMDMVIENDWGNVLVIEDDTDFYMDDDHITQANTFMAALKTREWNVALLGGNYFCVYEHEPEHYLFKLMMSYCANAYIVNRHYAETMRTIFRESYALMTATEEPDESKGIDAYWCRYMEKGGWYGLYPCIAYQRTCFSNIRRGHVNYEFLFNKPLETLYFATEEQKKTAVL